MMRLATDLKEKRSNKAMESLLGRHKSIRRGTIKQYESMVKNSMCNIQATHHLGNAKSLTDMRHLYEYRKHFNNSRLTRDNFLVSVCIQSDENEARKYLKSTPNQVFSWWCY